MGLENLNAVDAVGIETESDYVVLSIIDSWDWSNERSHLLALQGKLNSYFGFVESGQIYDTYPSSAGKSLCIDLVSRYPLPTTALDFLYKAKVVSEELAISLRWNTLHASTVA